MKKLIERIVLCGMAVGTVVCLAGCPKNSDGIDQPAKPGSKMEDNPMYKKSLESSPKPK